MIDNEIVLIALKLVSSQIHFKQLLTHLKHVQEAQVLLILSSVTSVPWSLSLSQSAMRPFTRSALIRSLEDAQEQQPTAETLW